MKPNSVEFYELRKKLGIRLIDAAKMLYRTPRQMQRYESKLEGKGAPDLPPELLELFKFKTGVVGE